MVEALAGFAQVTGIHAFMHSAWGWPLVESLHFFGLCLLLGTVGVFDLRLLGLGRGIACADLHRLVPYGVAGYGLNVFTGGLFLVSAPDQYLFNPAFQVKLLLMIVAGINVLLFYGTTVAAVKSTAAGHGVLFRARLMGLVSLLCWSGVIICGRLITYFRPPYHWCWWC